MNPIVIHTDGSCETQTRIGGWAAFLQCGEHQRVLQGSASDTTVNAMELTAVNEALKARRQPGSSVQLFTDSRVDKLAQGARMAHGQTKAEPEVEPQPLPAPPPKLHIMVAGSRYATGEMLAYARRVVQRAHQLRHVIVVGDNPQGVDRVVVQECRRLKAAVVVVGAANFPRNGGCRHGQYIKVERDLYRAAGGHLLDKYTVRDRYMVDMCGLGIFIWNGDSRGTKAGYDYALLRGKTAHLMNFSREVVP